MAPLTKSGAGLRIDDPGWADARTAVQIRQQLFDARFLVLRNMFTTLKQVHAFLRRLGPLNEAATRQRGVVVVDTSGKDEVFRSNAALPLHKDGILTGFDVAIVGIWCVEFDEVVGGRTLVADAASALPDLATEDRALLHAAGFEALAIDQSGYYRPELTGKWTRFPAFHARRGRTPTLHLGLPHVRGEPESWRVRIPGVPEAQSEQLFDRLREKLLDPRFVYWHDWQPGDLLLLDNYAVMHGRESFRARSRRLANLQVLVEDGPA